jgi:hypothetical protein
VTRPKRAPRVRKADGTLADVVDITGQDPGSAGSSRTPTLDVDTTIGGVDNDDLTGAGAPDPQGAVVELTTAELTTALLCDYAQVRNGLLTVVGGAITKVSRADYPGPFGVNVAVVADVPYEEVGRLLPVAVVLAGEAGEVQRWTTELNTRWEGSPGEWLAVPFVVPSAGCQIPAPGNYEVQIEIAGDIKRRLGFVAAATG